MVFDHLVEMDDTLLKLAFRIIEIAGKCGHQADGYNFEHKSRWVLQKAHLDAARHEKLAELCRALLKDLQDRGRTAQREYALIAETLDADRLSKETAMEVLRNSG